MKLEGKQNMAWERVEIVVRIASSILIPIVLAITGFSVNETLKDRELKAKYVELAIKILQASPPQSKSTSEMEQDKAIRRWAVSVISTYAPYDVRLPPELGNSLRREMEWLMADPIAKPILRD